jgi:hypothetical protein
MPSGFPFLTLMKNFEIIALLREFLESEEEHFWLVDQRVHFGGGFEAFEAHFDDIGADFLASALRRHSEDPGWYWWQSLKAPYGEDSSTHALAAMLPLIRLSRNAASEILRGLDDGWSGHPEVLIPTLVNRAGLKIQDIGGTGSFTPAEHIGRWYDDRTWHWNGPVSFVPGRIHFPVDPRDTGWACDVLASEPTVAFLFLTRGEVNQPRIWREYLTEAGIHAKVYAHSKHPEGLGADSFLRERQVSGRVPTEWGTISLVQATLAMIRAALEDPDVTHFVLASESCVPIKPFSALSRSIRLDARSRLAMFSHASVRRGGNEEKARRLDRLAGIAPEHAWFQEQWMCLNREDATIVSGSDWSAHFEKVWAPDECYFSTVLSAAGKAPGLGILNRPVTWTKWHGGAHPQSFDSVTPRLAGEFVDSGCFFARKFGPESDIGRWDLHLDTQVSKRLFRFESEAR